MGSGFRIETKKISWFHSNIWIQAEFYLTFNITLNCAHVHVAYIKVILFYSFFIFITFKRHLSVAFTYITFH